MVSALAASLSALEVHQQALVSKLEAIHAQLVQGEQDDDLLPTLTYYINQARFVQRRMMLIHSRVRDLKRRSDRLKEHRAKQDKQVADWAEQERSRIVPAAAVAAAAPAAPAAAPSPVPGVNRKAKSSNDDDAPGVAILDLPPNLLGVPVPDTPKSTSQPAAAASSDVDRPTKLQPSAGANPSTPESNSARAANAPSPPGVAQIASIKRKGKRRVRVPTID
ncbi:hypothetical protein GGI12_000984 [Dipsacomyces acuminosporus]|nr:hypothetical protein GGI12_000984 [Dipsacomyces acuminosporus]